MTFVATGSEIARAISNARLFVDSKAEYAPDVVHVELSETGVAFAGFDDYAVGRDEIGNVGDFPLYFEVTDEGAEAIEKAARSARNASVSLALDEISLVLTVGEEETETRALEASEAWRVVLPLLEPSCEPAELPRTVAFQGARLARFGRVKGVKDAPIDIRFEPNESGAPTALVRVGPTFRGELQGLRRDVAAEHLGASAGLCFWE
ncbi:hypothetical protein [Dactylosporangium sp. CA-139066]|uniref:hypothetical protein n=1 Tax=Dactylosporangium sp. CA-139066 TaxID=3239930 RepID=UPI003D8E5DCF